MKLKVEHFHVYDLVTVCFDYASEYYAQDTGNQCSTLGRLICWKWHVPDCDKTSENESWKWSIWNKFYIKDVCL